ncbi:MAG: hypothetical protein ACE5FT_04875 [Candidatus Nanoarchaeia archaeon]
MEKGIARDLIAFGSLPFFLIVMIRSIIGRYAPFVLQLTIALIAIYIFNHFSKMDLYIARSFVLVTFTSLFYKELPYTTFAAILWVAVGAQKYRKVKQPLITKAVIFSIMSVLISSFATPLIV